MTQDQFRDKYNQVKELIKGHGPEIARGSGYSYNTYSNVIRGTVTDGVKISAVWESMKDKVDEIMAGIESL